jgi:hypothetical protein
MRSGAPTIRGREPVELARRCEEDPQLPPATCERVEPIARDWESDRRLHIHTIDSSAVDWRIELGSTPITRLMSSIGSALPISAWRSRPVLTTMSRLAGRLLGVGTVKLIGMISNGQPFDALVEGQELGPIGRLVEQAHPGDFYIPQRGIFAIGRVFVTPVAAGPPAAVPVEGVLR